MTFDTKTSLQAGFPAVYLFAFSFIALGIPVFLFFKSFQSSLDWLWTAVISVLALIVLLRVFQEQAKQRKYCLVLDQDASLYLVKSRSGSDKRYPVRRSKFTLQSRKLVFASLMLDGGKKSHLVFHGFNNHSDDFRRFKVTLKWGDLL